MKDRSKAGLTVTNAEWSGKNTSGYQALDFKVLVKRDKVEPTSGLIEIPQEAVDKERWNVPEGVIVSAGDQAFRTNRVRRDGTPIYWEPKPKEGDRVIFQEFTGQEITGNDDEIYLWLTDKDIIGVYSV